LRFHRSLLVLFLSSFRLLETISRDLQELHEVPIKIRGIPSVVLPIHAGSGEILAAREAPEATRKGPSTNNPLQPAISIVRT
jgi:hypothetical protein